MNTNYSLGNYQQSVNFNGNVDKKTMKLAKKLGGEVAESLENLAGSTTKNTVIKLNEMGADYGIFAFNKKSGYGLTVGLAPKESLAETIKFINPKTVDEGIVNKSIVSIKETAAASPLNTLEKGFLRSEAKETLRMQRELGIQKPFWSETKKLMQEAEDRADKDRILDTKRYHEMRMVELEDNFI